jgi:hypothetical protein
MSEINAACFFYYQGIVRFEFAPEGQTIKIFISQF